MPGIFVVRGEALEARDQRILFEDSNQDIPLIWDSRT